MGRLGGSVRHRPPGATRPTSKRIPHSCGDIQRPQEDLDAVEGDVADERDEQVLGEIVARGEHDAEGEEHPERDGLAAGLDGHARVHDHEQQARHGDGDGGVEPLLQVALDDAAEEQLLQRDGDDRRDGKQDEVEGEVGRLADRRLGGVDSDYCESFRD